MYLTWPWNLKIISKIRQFWKKNLYKIKQDSKNIISWIKFVFTLSSSRSAQQRSMGVMGPALSKKYQTSRKTYDKFKKQQDPSWTQN